jgi:uncharacterized membrane protein YjjB (DUF3815 family)
MIPALPDGAKSIERLGIIAISLARTGSVPGEYTVRAPAFVILPGATVFQLVASVVTIMQGEESLDGTEK